MMKGIISIFLIFMTSCISQNQFASPSIKRECIDLLTRRIILNIPTPAHSEKENYEEGVIYTYIFKDGGCIIIHEGALMQFDMDSFKPSEVIHKQKYSIYGGKENGKFWKKYVCGGVRLYYYNVNTEDKIKYEKVIRTMKILNID